MALSDQSAFDRLRAENEKLREILQRCAEGDCDGWNCRGRASAVLAQLASDDTETK